MNFMKRYRLKKRQAELMMAYSILEQLQTEHSEDERFCGYMQTEMDLLDQEADHIRAILESGWR